MSVSHDPERDSAPDPAEADDDQQLPTHADTWLEEVSEVEDPEVAEQRRELTVRLTTSPHRTAMLSSFGRLLQLLSKILFAHVLFEKRCADNLTDAHDRGSVVYVLQSRSLLDYLYMNWAFLEHGIPIARFSNGFGTHWLRGFFAGLREAVRRRSAVKPEETVHALVLNDEPVLLFLEEPHATPDQNVEFSQKFLYRLVRAQRRSPTPIFIVPMLLVWERRPDAQHSTLVEEVFGTPQAPGFFRKFINWFQTIWQSFLRFGQPIAQVSSGIDLSQFLREYPNAGTADVTELLRERLMEHLERERHVILGPQGDPSPTLWKRISQQPELTMAVRKVAEEEGESEAAILKRAREQFDEIAAEPSLLIQKMFSAVLSLIWYRIYDGLEVDSEGLERTREAAKSSSIVLIPSHKSHIDYLIISYVFYNFGLRSPLIAAGVNLSFWPLGWLFRRGGAFFIRRSFKGEALYPVVFREYLIKLMEAGYPIEFFIEGTRSRTGKLVKPKYGMVDMIVRAYAAGRVESVKLVPISVGYEKIIEEGAHKTEQLGGEKEKESLSGLLKTPRFLTSKYGRLYIEFDEPLDVGEYLDKYELAGLDPGELEARDADIDALVVRLGHRIIYDINRVTTVTPTALTSMVLLGGEARGIDRHRFLGEVGFLLRFLTEEQRDVRLSRTLADAIQTRSASIQRLEAAESLRRERADQQRSTERNLAVESVMGNAASDLLDWAVDSFRRNGQVRISDEGDQQRYSVPDDARLELSYYRNSIVHHFVPEGLLAAAICRFGESEIELPALMRETLFLSRLFKHEWFYEERAEFRNVFSRTLRYFETSGWVKLSGEAARPADEVGTPTGELVRVSEPAAPEIEFFRRQVLSFLEAYAIVAAWLPELRDREQDEGDVIKGLLKRARADYGSGRILFQESMSKPTYQNALRLLSDWGVVVRRWDEGKKKTYIQVAEGWREGAELQELREHLDAFVYPERAE